MHRGSVPDSAGEAYNDTQTFGRLGRRYPLLFFYFYAFGVLILALLDPRLAN